MSATTRGTPPHAETRAERLASLLVAKLTKMERLKGNKRMDPGDKRQVARSRELIAKSRALLVETDLRGSLIATGGVS